MSLPRLHALIPAAGRGARYGGDLPKQYLALGDATMLEHAIAGLLADSRIDRVVVVVAPDDARIDALRLDARVPIARVGGDSRRPALGLRATPSEFRQRLSRH